MSDTETVDYDTDITAFEDEGAIEGNDIESEPFEYDGEEYSREQLESFIKDYQNNNRWKSSNQKKAEQLKTEREQFETEKAALDERRKKLVEKERSIDRAGGISRMQSEADKRTIEADSREALLNMREKFPDLDYQKLKDFAKLYNDQFNFEDRIELMYYAERGSRLDQLLEEERAKVFREAKKKKGLPKYGMTGGSVPIDTTMDKAELKRRMRSKLRGDNY